MNRKQVKWNCGHRDKNKVEDDKRQQRDLKRQLKMNLGDLVSVDGLDESGNFSMSVIIGNAKRSRNSSNSEREQDELIGGLPDHLAQVILSAVNRPSILYSVSKSWRKLIYSPSFPPFLCMYAILSTTCSPSIEFMCLDPISLRWCSLPPPPQPDLLLTRHPSFIARSLPIQAVSVGNHLVILAATTQHLLPALSRPLIFSPLTKLWRLGPPISTPRRWCAAGSLGQTVYLASGVGSSGYTQDVARSAQKWVLEPDHHKWENVAPLKHKHGRFSREAVEAVGWRGKLCLVNVKGNVVKEGVVYDRERDAWEDMNQGLLLGWNGPAASMDEDVIYCVDQANGLLMRYDSHAHSWDTILHSPELLKGAAQVVARGGRVCVVRPAPAPAVVLDVVARPPKVIFLLHPPRPEHPGFGFEVRDNQLDVYGIFMKGFEKVRSIFNVIPNNTGANAYETHDQVRFFNLITADIEKFPSLPEDFDENFYCAEQAWFKAIWYSFEFNECCELMQVILDRKDKYLVYNRWG